MEDILNGTGFLHFVVANEDDHYYLKGCRKLSFQELMYYKLFQKGFRNIYYINEFYDNELMLVCFNKMSKSLLEKKSNNIFKGVITSVFSRKDTCDNYDDNYLYIQNLCVQIGIEDGLKSLLRIYRMSTSSSKTAIIISLNVLSRIYNDSTNGLFKEIAEIKNNDDNVFIVVFPPDGNSMELIAPKDKCYDTSKGIFNAPIFPSELKNIYNNKKSAHLFFFPMEAVSNIMRERLVFLNRLEKDDIDNFIEYYFLRTHNEYSPEVLENIEWISLFIWAWYNVDCFSDACGFELKKNPLRKFDVIEQSIDNYTLTKMNDYVYTIKKENCDITCDRFFKSIDSGEKSMIFLVNDKNCPVFVDGIFDIRREVFRIEKDCGNTIIRSNLWKIFQNIDKQICRIYRTGIEFNYCFNIDILVEKIKRMICGFTNNKDKERIISGGELFEIMNMMVSDYYEQISTVVYDNLNDQIYTWLSETKFNLYSAMIDYIYKTNEENESRKYLYEAKSIMVDINRCFKNIGNYRSVGDCESVINSADVLINIIKSRIADGNELLRL